MEDECAALLPAIGGFMSLIFSLSGGLWCRVVAIAPNHSFSDIGTSNGTQSQGLEDLPYRNLGLWKQQDIDYAGTVVDESSQNVAVVFSSSCVDYPDSLASDSMWKAAIGLQTATYVLSTVLSCVLVVSLCGCRMSVARMRLIGLLFVVGCSLFQGLTFLIFRSNLCSSQLTSTTFGMLQAAGIYESSCTLGRGGILICLAVAGYFVTGLLCLKVRPMQR
ncbi:hypothetical protein MPSEU_001003800 [Mayamaea pseudoterrestris]|nr:hypothetical protein MPSEU_001003800 [Mayamaea pseudoterrestris]